MFEQWRTFSLEQVWISETYQATYLLCGHMEVSYLMSTRPTECWLATLNASSRIFCDNVTCFGTNKAGRRKLLVEFLSCTARWSKKQGAEMLTGNARRIFCEKTHALCDIGLSEVGLRLKAWESFRYLCPADCFQDILFQQTGNSHWNKLGILTGTSWHFMAFLRHIKWHICSVDAWKYLTWCQQGQWKAD